MYSDAAGSGGAALTVFVFIGLLSTTTALAGEWTHPYPPRDYGKWVNHGGDLTNRRWPLLETQISTSSVRQLRTEWSFTTEGDVTATPSISDGVVYFPDWAGGLYAVNQKTGALIWKRNLTALAARSLGSAVSWNATLLGRSAPTIAGDRLLVTLYGPCAVLAVSRSTGSLLWAKVLDTHPLGIITMSGTAYEGYYYIGSSSTEEGSAVICCTFQGAFFKLDLEDGEIMWRVPMLPDNGGRSDLYAGNAVWGSSPPVDVKRRDVYIATGNNYRVPEEIEQCELNYRNLTDPPIPDPCIVVDNHAESVLAINIDTGNITWSKHLGGYDTWIVTCSIAIPGLGNCPAIPGPDYDFGEAPLLLTIPGTTNSSSSSSSSCGRDIVVVGQKSGIVWALDRESGQTVWDTAAGPGGPGGGSMWGMTSDGERVFTNIVNSNGQNFTLLPGTQIINSSGWVGLNASTGQVLWSTAAPSGSWNAAPLTHANGVVFGGKASVPAALVGLDAKTGRILSSTLTNGSAYGGPSVAQGCLFQPLGVTPTGAATAAILRNQTLPSANSVVAFCAPSATH